MGLFGGDSDNSSKTKVYADTRQVDRRVAGSDSAQVATEGGRVTNDTRNISRSTTTKNVTVRSADAKVIQAALAGSSANLSAALEFSTRQAERDADTVSAALANAQPALAGLQSSNRSIVYVVAAIAAAVAIAWGLRR